jgi:hypothetical protein
MKTTKKRRRVPRSVLRNVRPKHWTLLPTRPTHRIHVFQKLPLELTHIVWNLLRPRSVSVFFKVVSAVKISLCYNFPMPASMSIENFGKKQRRTVRIYHRINNREDTCILIIKLIRYDSTNMPMTRYLTSSIWLNQRGRWQNSKDD